MKSSILDKEPVQRVVSLLMEAEAAVEESPTSSSYGSAASNLRIIDAFDFPKFRYDPIKKLFYKYAISSGNIRVLLLTESVCFTFISSVIRYFICIFLRY